MMIQVGAAAVLPGGVAFIISRDISGSITCLQQQDRDRE